MCLMLCLRRRVPVSVLSVFCRVCVVGCGSTAYLAVCLHVSSHASSQFNVSSG